MAKQTAKQKGVGGPNIPKDKSPLDKQVEDGDTITVEDVKQFVVDAKKKQEDYKQIADRSWSEIEKRDKLGNLYGGGESATRSKRWAKFPLWWSCWKIRQPITLARLAVPVLKDTQGDDPYGRTACVLGERLTKGILKTFDVFSEFSASNDDFLVTNFGWGRWCYRSEEVEEEEKIRLQMMQPPPPEPPPEEMAPEEEPEIGPDGEAVLLEGEPPPEEVPPEEGMEEPPEGEELPPEEMPEEEPPPEPLPPLFFTPDGQEIPITEVREDDLGPYYSTGRMVTVDNEEVYFKAGRYPCLLVDPDAVRWNEVTRIVFEYPYHYREFKQKFGKAALEKLTQSDLHEYKSGRKPIMVYEYYDSILKEVRWCSENSEAFFQPAQMYSKNDEEYDNSDLYGLTGFFPCSEPLIINQSTRSFWPTPEYFQVQDILDDISSIVTRMIQLTKAVRIRFLFDSSVKALQPLIGENWASGEGTGMGIPNLEQSLMNNRGSLANLVAYFPIDDLMKGLQNMYGAYEQRLNMFYNITGFSDLIRGQTSDNDKTFGERQLEGKFALNRAEPYQRKVQEWIKDNYQIGMELALKMFSDQTIDEYIVPQTLDKEDQQRYQAALDMLKNNRRGRFRMEFETDSTISINQDWKKKQAAETANAITKMMESTAKVATDMPELAEAELKIMKHVVAELTDGKLFMDEITEAIQKTIESVNAPKPPEPDPDMEKLKVEQERVKIEGQKMMLEGERFKLSMRNQDFIESKALREDQFTQMQMQMEQTLEGARVAQADRMANIEMQLEQFKIQSEMQAGQMKLQADTEKISAELGLKAQQIQADIQLAQEELAAKREEMMVAAQDVASKSEIKQLEVIFDHRIAEQKQKLDEIYFSLEKEKVMLDEREKYATEARLQAEHELQKAQQGIQTISSIADLHNSLKDDEKEKK